MMEKQIANAILEKGVDFEITVTRKNILHKFGMLPEKKKFVIYPIKLGTLLLISEALVQAKIKSPDKLKGHELLDAALNSIIDNEKLVVQVIAFAILNRKIDTILDKIKAKRLSKYIERNLTAQESIKLLNIVITQMDIQSFFGFMVSIRGMDVIGAEPTSGESLEESSNTTDSAESTSSGKSAGKI